MLKWVLHGKQFTLLLNDVEKATLLLKDKGHSMVGLPDAVGLLNTKGS